MEIKLYFKKTILDKVGLNLDKVAKILIESIIEDLISCNIDYIIDGFLIDEFVDNPLSYINDDIIIDEDVQIVLNSCIREKLNEKLSVLC